MVPYIIAFVATAVFPLALAGYGGHLAAIAMPQDTTKRRTTLAIVWSLAILGVITSGISTILAYRADKAREVGDVAFHSEVLGKLQHIVDEPNEAKKKQDATALTKAVQSDRLSSSRYGIFTQETLQSAIPGHTYTLQFQPKAGLPVTLYYNGLVQRAGIDYTVNKQRLSVNFQTTRGDSLWITYYH